MRRQIWRRVTIGPATVVLGALAAATVVQAQNAPYQQPPRHLPWRPAASRPIPTTAQEPYYHPAQPPAPQQGWPPAVPPTTAQAAPPQQVNPRPFPQPQQGHGVIRTAFPSSEQSQPQLAPKPVPPAPQPGAQPPGQPLAQGNTVLEKLQSLSLMAHPEFRERIGNEHPIMPALRWAKAGLPYVEAIDDYCCTLIKQERVNGELKPPQHLFLKVRHRPFSVYVYFLTPEAERGQEAIYVEGQNKGCLLAHGVGIRAVMGTVALKPDGVLAMSGNRYPITHVGIANLVRELIAVGENDIQYGESEVKYYFGAKVNGRSCTCVEFRHPVPRREFRYHIARIFVDDELNLPVHYEAYDWPEKPGGEPILTERYTYVNLKLNNGFTDMDFDIRNPNYGFSK